MFNVSKFLKKDNHIKNKDEEKIASVIKVIEDVSGVRVDFSEIEIRSGKIILTCDNLKKTQIFLYKEGVVEKINKKLKLKLDLI